MDSKGASSSIYHVIVPSRWLELRYKSADKLNRIYSQVRWHVGSYLFDLGSDQTETHLSILQLSHTLLEDSNLSCDSCAFFSSACVCFATGHHLGLPPTLGIPSLPGQVHHMPTEISKFQRANMTCSFWVVSIAFGFRCFKPKDTVSLLNKLALTMSHSSHS